MTTQNSKIRLISSIGLKWRLITYSYQPAIGKSHWSIQTGHSTRTVINKLYYLWRYFAEQCRKPWSMVGITGRKIRASKEWLQVGCQEHTQWPTPSSLSSLWAFRHTHGAFHTSGDFRLLVQVPEFKANLVCGSTCPYIIRKSKLKSSAHYYIWRTITGVFTLFSLFRQVAIFSYFKLLFFTITVEPLLSQ